MKYVLILLFVTLFVVPTKILKAREMNESKEQASTVGVTEPDAGTRKTLTFNGVEFAFRYCPTGRFTMGSPENEDGRAMSVAIELGVSADEPLRSVRINEGFWICETETTQEQWNAVGVKKERKCIFEGAKLPVETISWDECVAFVNKLNEAGVAPKGWRFELPTEEQWEYACRAGTTGTNYGVNLKNCAWYDEDIFTGSTHQAGTKEPNKWGIYDMLGNVWEWTSTQGENGKSRVGRGGGWTADADFCRPAKRGFFDPSEHYIAVGFRIVLVRR